MPFTTNQEWSVPQQPLTTGEALESIRGGLATEVLTQDGLGTLFRLQDGREFWLQIYGAGVINNDLG